MTSLAFKQWALDNNDKFPTQVSVTNGGAMEMVQQGEVWAAFLVKLNTPRVLFCPGESDRKRKVANVWLDSNVSAYAGFMPSLFTNNINTSYFIGVDAEETKPQMLLVGDSHFAIGGKRVTPGVVRLGTNSPVGWPKPIRKRHDKGGNIGLADGSVINCDDKGFAELLRRSGDSTNRLAIP